MNNYQVHEALCYLNPQFIQEAAQSTTRRKNRLRTVVLAACLSLLIALPVMAVTGTLLVEHFFGDAIPEHLSDQNLDAFFQVSSSEKIPLASLSQQAQDAANTQEESHGYHGFDSWDDAERFLEIEILASDLLSNAYPVDLLNADGTPVLRAPCHLTLYKKDDALYSIALNYFFQNPEGISISLNAHAVTDQNPHDNNSSLGIGIESSSALQQTAEEYLTASGAKTTVISTQFSDGHDWNIDGWAQKNGFVLRFTVSAPQEETGKQIIYSLLDSIR